jgi:hypothetical protein
MLSLTEFEAIVSKSEPVRHCSCGRRMAYGAGRCNRCGAAHERRLARLLVARVGRHGAPPLPEFTPLHFLQEVPADAAPLPMLPKRQGRKPGQVTAEERHCLAARSRLLNSRWYILLSPASEYVAAFNLNEFCAAHGLAAGRLREMSRQGLPSQGWFVTSDAFPVPREKRKPGPKPGKDSF